MIVAVIALFVALGGSSYAAVKLNGKNIKKNTVTGKQVKERSLKKVPKAKAADTAASATTASGATPAVPADQARGITAANVTENGTFVCFNGLAFEPRHVQVTTYRVGGSTVEYVPNATLDQSTSFCPGNEQAAVQLVDPDAAGDNSVADARFYIALYK